MLRTLEKYIADPATPRVWHGRDRRFPKLLALSVICHLIFYAAIIRLDHWSIQQQLDRRSQRDQLVKFVDIAPPPERLPKLRSLPQRIDRVDLSRLRLDPSHANDEDLIERSPKLGNPNAVSNVPRELKPTVEASSPKPERAAVPKEASSPAPAPAVARTEPPQVSRTQVAPSSTQTQSNSAAARDDTGERSARREEASGTRDLGLQAVQAQYYAYIRKKIRDWNERIMPREWIRDVLNRQVSADFEVKLGRSGDILSARLIRSSGYSSLDDVGRQAIYTARPFEGFPPTAGDILTLTVTVYYSPTW